MNGLLRLTVFLLGLLFVAITVYLLVKKRLNERTSLLWLAGALAAFILSAIPQVLNGIARAVGVDYPPALLFLVAILALLVIVLYQSTQISRLQDQVKELAQNIAVAGFDAASTDAAWANADGQKGTVADECP